jgi:aspartyl-tRNA synthetase
MSFRNIFSNKIGNKINKKITLAGWWCNYRDHGGIIFGELRDDSGIAQLVIEDVNLIKQSIKIPLESVIQVTGIVLLRSEENINLSLESGRFEVLINKIIILSQSKELPFHINDSHHINEELRLKYRFLDLRNPLQKKIIKTRSDLLFFVRQKMRSMGFIEIQTPILTASSPEGAREYVVFSCRSNGKCYVTPQSPQIFKQILMVSGMNKYFQIAPCFRDEDARKDRAVGEFYQIDFEMSFVNQSDILKVLNNLIISIFKKFTSGKKIHKFITMTYDMAMKKYGCDKPDLRNPLILEDCTNLFKNSSFNLFANAINLGKYIQGVRVNRSHIARETTRGDFDRINELSQREYQFHLGYVYTEIDEYKGPIGKFFTPEMKNLLDLKKDECIFFLCDEKEILQKNAIKALNLICDYFDLREKNSFRFVFVKDFPMYEKNDMGKIEFSHNPFSMPQGGLKSLLSKDPLTIKAEQYDIICNGIELSSGAIRNHDPQCLLEAFKIANYTEEEVYQKFTSLMSALSYGAPPHGGAAPGFDRILMLITDAMNVRDVIAFPLSGSGADMLTGAPTYLSETKMKELNLKILKELVLKQPKSKKKP